MVSGRLAVVVEADHAKLKSLIKPVRGLKTLKTAWATIEGFEVIHLLAALNLEPETQTTTRDERLEDHLTALVGAMLNSGPAADNINAAHVHH